MAFQSEKTPSVLADYEDVVLYEGYAYGLSASGGEAIAHEEAGQWKLVCQAGHHLVGSELLGECGIPIGTARHLRVLQKKGMSHELYVSNL